MRKATSQILNVEDCIGADGLWKRSYCMQYPSVIIQYHTKAAVLWANINNRCKDGGAYQKNNPSYKGCKNNFKDFQCFAEWCNSQFGYGLPGWHLDKDLLGNEEKSYGDNTCVFLPSRVNQMITAFSKDGKGPLSKGVFLSGSRFGAQVSNGNRGFLHIGCFETEREAADMAARARASLLRKETEEMNHPDQRVSVAIEKIIHKMCQALGVEQ